MVYETRMKVLSAPKATPHLDLTCRHCEAKLRAEGKKDIKRWATEGTIRGEDPAAVFVCPLCKGEMWVTRSLVPKDWRP
jgi:hypothetical protein